MSDEHLAIILRGIKARLELALTQASEGLPEEERLTHMVHVADSCEPYLLHLPCDDDEHWAERVALHPIALDPIANLVDELTHEISHLMNARKQSAPPVIGRTKARPAKRRAAKKGR